MATPTSIGRQAELARGRQRLEPPPELKPFIEALAELLVADHLRREAERAGGLKPSRRRATGKKRKPSALGRGGRAGAGSTKGATTMSDPAVVGMWTGIIGAASGLGGLFVSVWNYRRVSAIEALDLRVELRREFNDHKLLRERIEQFLVSVNESHRRVLHAQGQLGSGTAHLWGKEFEKDSATLKQLLDTAPQEPADYKQLSSFELEDQLVLLHRSSGELKALREKYQGTIEKDEEWRREREQQMRR